MQAATNRVPSQVAVLLWELVAASAHIIVPVATYNLKVQPLPTFVRMHASQIPQKLATLLIMCMCYVCVSPLLGSHHLLRV